MNNWLKHPSFKILSSNVLTGFISFLISLTALRWIKVEEYGSFALIFSFFSLSTNFVDFRINDYISSRFFDKKNSPAQLLWFSVVVNSLLAILILTIGFIGIKIFWPIFSKSQYSNTLFLLVGLGVAGNFLASSIIFLFRLVQHFNLIILSNIINVILSFIFYIIFVSFFKTIDSYIWAFALSGLSNLLLSLVFLVLKFPYPNLSIQFSEQLAQLKFNKSFIIYGNFSGYIKLLHRSADTLVIGYFFGEHATGIYKFARTVSDKLYLLYDALNQVYFPRLLEYLESDYKLFLRVTKKLITFSWISTFTILLLEILVWNTFCELFLNGQYKEAKLPTVILTSALFFVLGPFLTHYPLILKDKKLKNYVLINFLSVLFLQYLVPIITKAKFGFTIFAIGYSLSYVPLAIYFLNYRLTRKHT